MMKSVQCQNSNHVQILLLLIKVGKRMFTIRTVPFSNLALDKNTFALFVIGIDL